MDWHEVGRRAQGLTWRKGIRESSQGITVIGYLWVWPIDEDMAMVGVCGCSVGTAGFKWQPGKSHPLVTKASCRSSGREGVPVEALWSLPTRGCGFVTFLCSLG